MLYITFGCGEAAWSETLTSLGTCHAPSHLLCQVHWKLYLHGFSFKRGQLCLENSPAMQANVSALSFSHMLWLNLACLADLKALQEGCMCPCPALAMLCGAGILTHHVILTAQVPPMQPGISGTTVTQGPLHRKQSKKHLHRQTSRSPGKMTCPCGVLLSSSVAELMRLMTSVPQLSA